MAGPAHDRSLGRARSGRGARLGRAGGKGLPRRFLPAGSKNQPVPKLATLYLGWPFVEERNRQHRTTMKFDLRSRAVAEFLGTAFLLAAVVGSGIMGERLAGGNVAIALLANTLATGAALVALILTFGPISGAHFNPAVTLADATQGGGPWREVPGYVTAQLCGAFVGVAAANLMFGEPLFSASRRARSGGAQIFSEFVATFGLLTVIWG